MVGTYNMFVLWERYFYFWRWLIYLPTKVLKMDTSKSYTYQVSYGIGKDSQATTEYADNSWTWKVPDQNHDCTRVYE